MLEHNILLKLLLNIYILDIFNIMETTYLNMAYPI